MITLILKDIFAYLFSIHNIISLSCHEQVCLSGLFFFFFFLFFRFERNERKEVKFVIELKFVIEVNRTKVCNRTKTSKS